MFLYIIVPITVYSTYSNKDRLLVLKGITSLAFTLMSTDQKLKNNVMVVQCVGAEIIREVVKKRHETVAIILQELVDKIVAGGIPTTHYTGNKK